MAFEFPEDLKKKDFSWFILLLPPCTGQAPEEPAPEEPPEEPAPEVFLTRQRKATTAEALCTCRRTIASRQHDFFISRHLIGTHGPLSVEIEQDFLPEIFGNSKARNFAG